MRKRYQAFRFAKKNHTPDDSHLLVTPNKKKAKKKNWIKTVIIAVVAALVLVVGYIAYASIHAANNIFSSNIGLSDLINKPTLKDDNGVTNILLLGRGGSGHPGGLLTDTIILARFKKDTNQLAMISIPRDLQVKIPGDGESRINEAFSTGYNSLKNEKDEKKKTDAGAKLAEQVVANVTGVPIQYYVMVDFIGFTDLVNKLGGITVTVDQNLSDPYYPKDSIVNGTYQKTDAYAPFSIKAGVQTLNGETALKFARSRETTSDFDRAKRQQKVIFAIKEKALSLGVLANPQKLIDIIDNIGNHIRTSMTLSETKAGIDLFGKVDKEKVINKVIDDNATDGLLVSSSVGFYHLTPKTGNFTQIQNMVKNIFDESGQSLIEVEVFNATKKAGLASTFAATLKAQGINVTNIETSATTQTNTEIQDGTKGSTTYNTIKSKLPTAKTTTSSQSGVIKVILGTDYGS